MEQPEGQADTALPDAQDTGADPAAAPEQSPAEPAPEQTAAESGPEAGVTTEAVPSEPPVQEATPTEPAAPAPSTAAEPEHTPEPPTGTDEAAAPEAPESASETPTSEGAPQQDSLAAEATPEAEAAPAVEQEQTAPQNDAAAPVSSRPASAATEQPDAPAPTADEQSTPAPASDDAQTEVAGASIDAAEAADQPAQAPESTAEVPAEPAADGTEASEQAAAPAADPTDDSQTVLHQRHSHAAPAPAPEKSIRTTPYETSEFTQEIDPAIQLPLSSAPTLHLLSLDAQRRNNLSYIEDDVVVMAAGNRVVLLKLPEMTQTYVPGLDGGSIGAVAVHPSRKFLAVAEKCHHRAPNIYVYHYPALTLHKVMHDGTEHAYSALIFNEEGDQLASIGGWPDYLITLWRWDQEAIVLRSKAFSQDVYTVRFSPYFNGNLVTCGTGHIRFWKMAATFTGLKLQGQLGKFGNVELTDVSAFVEMPDGKVLSSTETGELLMWDGGLIKVVLTRGKNKPCHEGQVHVLMHDRGSNTILSAGADGYVRLWDFNRINEAEPDEDSHFMEINPIDEVLVCPGSHVRSLVWERRHWLVLDGTGALVKVDLPQAGLPSKGATMSRLLEFHAGGIVGMLTSPCAHIAMTASKDGSVRVYDYHARSQMHSLAFNQPATCMAGVGKSGNQAVVGFKDGVVRAVVHTAAGLRMASAFKPHKGPVNLVSISPDNSLLVTGGHDSTLFFFSISQPFNFSPVCYMKLPAAATCACWSEDGSAVLVGLSSSQVVEVQAPAPGSVDTHKTYEVELPMRVFKFKMPKRREKVKRRKQAAASAGGGEGGEPAPAAPDASATPAATSEGAPAADKPVAEEEMEEVEIVIDDDEFQEQDPMQVLTISYVPSSSSHFHLTLSGRAAGKVWRCDLHDDSSEPLEGFPAPASAPTSLLSYSPCKRLQILGTTDGIVRVQPLSSALGRPAGPYWQAPLHDMQQGRVTAAAVSFDGAYLLSGALDGTMYLQSMHIEGHSPAAPEPSASDLQLVSADQVPASVQDITNPSEYTLEEAKQKAEQDALEAAAEAKKMGVREYLQHIRAEFEALVAENDAKPEAERLPRSAFEIDVGLREMVAEETAKRIDAVRRELAWETEKRRLALAKLKKHFLDDVEVERVVLNSVRSKQYVTTFRTARLSEALLQELQAAKQAEAEQAEALQRRKEAAAAQAHAGSGPGAGLSAAAAVAAATAAGAAAVGANVDTSKMPKADLRRLARKQREAAWAAFNATKPDEKYEDPADVAAIEEAERNMGDFKLKSDPAYVVPEEERMTPQRKRFQMLLLEEVMHDTKMEFNRKFLALREVKKKVVEEINGRITQLRDIQALLGPSPGGEPELLVWAQPLSMKPEETPEDRDKVTDSDIEEFLKNKEEEERKAASGSALGGFAGGGGGGGGGGAKPAASLNKSQTTKGGAAAAAGAAAAGANGRAATPDSGAPPAAPAPAGSDDALTRIMLAVPVSDLERQLQNYHRRRLQVQKERLLTEIEEMSTAFDSALTSLRRDKFKLEKDLKICEMRQLVHSQELALLLDFDKREVVLIQKRAGRMDERNDIIEKITECSVKLEAKKAELEGLMARRASVAAEFDGAVPESDPFREPLTKIFYRKIKRSKKKATSGGNGDNESEDEDDEDEDEDEGDDDDDGDPSEEVCPPGCDQALYEKVCDLRERRLDEEELVADFSKAIDSLRKDRESLAKKQKLVEQSLAAINADIAAFQQEKQAALNQIEVVVNLHMHQIEYLADGRLPEDLSAALVFSSTQLDRLRKRIDELEDEKTELRQRHKTLKKEHLQLLKDKSEKEGRVSELETRAHDVQMLKFGQEVDMELLDALGASRGTEELRAELARQEIAHAKELAEWDARIAQRTDELMALTRENTGALNAVCALTSAQRGLEAGLTATRKTMFADPVAQRRQEVEERDALVQMVNAQAKELERLRVQVQALKRKDTSVYS